MRDPRAPLSGLVLVFFAATTVATSKPKESGEAGSSTFAEGPIFASVKAAATAPPPAAVCTDAVLEAAMKSVKVAESWEKIDPHDILLVDQGTGATFTRENAQKNNADDGWRWINAPKIRDLHPESYSAFEQSDSKISQNARSLALHPLVAVLRADVRKLPKPTGDTYEGGRLDGMLSVARTDTGAPICQIPVSAASSTSVRYKERGITGKTFEKALLDDFKSQVVSQVRKAVKTTTPSFTINLGT